MLTRVTLVQVLRDLVARLTQREPLARQAARAVLVGADNRHHEQAVAEEQNRATPIPTAASTILIADYPFGITPVTLHPGKCARCVLMASRLSAAMTKRVCCCSSPSVLNTV